ncbi:hypothetical protein [Acidicapsa ligni]|uniref:hypothetical protein n=1 Tax=Acidicapsa ligni TaxID=542300 RepID=UPI0021DFB25E|nr:hypothetical protein [Acidicapsa ligni]
MSAINDGQCGLCSHFGESHKSSDKLVAILSSHQASETLIDECGHPKHAPLHLMVTPVSGCDGFAPAAYA